MSEDSHRDCLWAACISELVLHTVSKGMHRKLLVGDDLAEPIHHHGGHSVHTSWSGIAFEDMGFWVFVIDECL